MTQKKKENELDPNTQLEKLPFMPALHKQKPPQLPTGVF
jgi:hypothetical protein